VQSVTRHIQLDSHVCHSPPPSPAGTPHLSSRPLQGRVESTRPRPQAAERAAVCGVPHTGIQVNDGGGAVMAAGNVRGREGVVVAGDSWHFAGAASRTCACATAGEFSRSYLHHEPPSTHPPLSRPPPLPPPHNTPCLTLNVGSAWADGCLIASTTCIARFNYHHGDHEQQHDVDLERSAADTRHATMLAESCDGVSLLLLR
jgi:hypothetical protein